MSKNAMNKMMIVVDCFLNFLLEISTEKAITFVTNPNTDKTMHTYPGHIWVRFEYPLDQKDFKAVCQIY